MTKQINNEKKLDLEVVFSQLVKSGNPLIIRFVDKLADSDKFTSTVHNVFNGIKNKHVNRIFRSIDKYESCSSEIFKFIFDQGSWNIYDLATGDLLLDKIDSKIAKKIARDSNTAYLIKASRLSNKITE
jgi:hypothetical protein